MIESLSCWPSSLGVPNNFVSELWNEFKIPNSTQNAQIKQKVINCIKRASVFIFANHWKLHICLQIVVQ